MNGLKILVNVKKSRTPFKQVYGFSFLGILTFCRFTLPEPRFPHLK